MMSRAVRSRPAFSTLGLDRRVPPTSSVTENSPVGCSTDIRLLDSVGHRRDALRHRARQDARRRDRHGAEHADRGVAVVRDERARADVTAGARRRDQAHLRHDLRRDVAEIHARADLQSDRLDLRFERLVRVELLRRLVARDAEVARTQHDDGHAVVDARDFDAVDDVEHAARRQQAARRRARDVEVVADDRRSRARHAVDPRVAVVVDALARRLDEQLAEVVAVQHAHAHGRHSVARFARGRARSRTARHRPRCCRSSASCRRGPRRRRPARTDSRCRRRSTPSGSRSRPCSSADARRRRRRSGARRCPSPRRARGRASLRRPAGLPCGSTAPSSCRRASTNNEWLFAWHVWYGQNGPPVIGPNNEATGRTKASGTRVLAALDRHALRARRWTDRASAQRASAPPASEIEVVQLRPNFYVIGGAGGNIVVQIGPEGVILVDSGSTATRRRGAGHDSPADAAADSLHHQHEHGRRPRRRQRGALEGGLEHPAGRGCGRRGVGRRRPREFRLRERARARERAHAHVLGRSADPVGVLADEDVLLPHVFDVLERRRHSGHPPAGRAHRRRRHRVLPPRRRDRDRRRHRHDALSVHRRRSAAARCRASSTR